MMEEIWKDIEGYEGIYQVSNIGRVRSLDRLVPAACAKPRNAPFCYLRDSKTGYVAQKSTKKSKKKNIF